MKRKSLLFVVLSIILVISTIAYGYTQFAKKSIISAVLQHKVDLNNPPNSISTITVLEQELPNGKILKKGSRLIGTISKNEDGYTITFNTLQPPKGKKLQISAKANLSTNSAVADKGISAKIGDTFHKQTKSTVLGAIFHSTAGSRNTLAGSTITRGTRLQIEVD